MIGQSPYPNTPQDGLSRQKVEQLLVGTVGIEPTTYPV